MTDLPIFSTLPELYAPIGWICLALSILTALTTTFAYDNIDLHRVLRNGLVGGIVVALLWPIALPFFAIALPFYTAARHKQRQEEEEDNDDLYFTRAHTRIRRDKRVDANAEREARIENDLAHCREIWND